MIEELHRVKQWLEYCGAMPTQYRPPFGILSEEQAHVITRFGWQVAMWNLETYVSSLCCTTSNSKTN